ncbi:MAG: HAD family hydrolase [Candidatus Eremiobacteraeota bacterium]|nr:HAD family hydrolase [Candidatus Eremiobacteraeota bacterium]MBV9262948.1 HAD family hydrolase [Candidatus Eremiobacteraeota bacterium]
MPKAVLLDLDGTLVDSTSAHAESWSRAFARYGYDVPSARIARWIGMGGDKLLRQVDPALDHTDGLGKSISQAREELFLSEYLPHLKPTNGARALLERIGEERSLRVIASSAKERELEALLKVAHIERLVDLTTNADDVDRSKPDPDVIAEALKKAGCSAEEAVYVGDTPYDVVAAHRAGVTAIGVTCGAWDGDGLKDAEAIYRDPAELVRSFDSSPLRNS